MDGCIIKQTLSPARPTNIASHGKNRINRTYPESNKHTFLQKMHSKKEKASRPPVITFHGNHMKSGLINKNGIKNMKKNIVETVLGAVVLLVAGVFLMFFYKTTDIAPSSGYVITAAFSNIDGLGSGSPVRVSGVKIGQVLDFSLNPENFRAIVRMNINNDIKLPMDTVAIIASSGLLGDKFLTLDPGNEEEFLSPGDQIEFTQSTPGIEQLLGQVIFNINKDKNNSTEDKDSNSKDNDSKDKNSDIENNDTPPSKI